MQITPSILLTFLRSVLLQVAHLDLPYDAATYMHRVGRTGRFGTHGIAIAFVTPAELQQLRGFLQDVAGGQV
jgi:superfamily II DNA/RNA helicase